MKNVLSLLILSAILSSNTILACELEQTCKYATKQISDGVYSNEEVSLSVSNDEDFIDVVIENKGTYSIYTNNDNADIDTIGGKLLHKDNNLNVIYAEEGEKISISSSSKDNSLCDITIQFGLPLSGYEPCYNDKDFKSMEKYNNCYTYALNVNKYSNGELFRQRGLSTGEIYSRFSRIVPETLKSNNEFVKWRMELALRLDMQTLGKDYIEVGKYDRVPEGYYKVALVLDNDLERPDYHWFRQDSNGLWSHKPGEGSVTNLVNHELIIEPDSQIFLEYDVFIGYYAIPYNLEIPYK